MWNESIGYPIKTDNIKGRETKLMSSNMMSLQIRQVNSKRYMEINKLYLFHLTPWNSLCGETTCRTRSSVIMFTIARIWDSPVSTVSGYGLDDRAIEVQSPAEAKRFFL
jgi:hypothetical protein